MMPRIVIGDSDPQCGTALASLVDQEPGVCLAGRAEDITSLVVLVAQQRPHLALIDLRLPGGDFADVVAAVRGLKPGISIIAMTALVSPAATHVAERAGVTVVVDKSDSDQVLDALKDLVG